MIIPKTLKIGGHIYKIIQDDTGKDLGYTYTSKLEIHLDRDMKQSQKEATLIHEIFHCLNTTFDRGDRHAVLDSVAEQLYQVLKENNLLK
jgi:hypothetical protein